MLVWVQFSHIPNGAQLLAEENPFGKWLASVGTEWRRARPEIWRGLRMMLCWATRIALSLGWTGLDSPPCPLLISFCGLGPLRTSPPFLSAHPLFTTSERKDPPWQGLDHRVRFSHKTQLVLASCGMPRVVMCWMRCSFSYILWNEILEKPSSDCEVAGEYWCSPGIVCITVCHTVTSQGSPVGQTGQWWQVTLV